MARVECLTRYPCGDTYVLGWSNSVLIRGHLLHWNAVLAVVVGTESVMLNANGNNNPITM